MNFQTRDEFFIHFYLRGHILNPEYKNVKLRWTTTMTIEL